MVLKTLLRCLHLAIEHLFLIIYLYKFIIYKITSRILTLLTSMLSQVQKKYETFKRSNQKSLQMLRSQLQQDAQAKTIQALKIQNHKVSKIHSNQQQIQNRLRRNSQLQSQLKIHLGGWLLLHDELSKAMKEAGDIAHYARYVQEQIRQMNQQLGNRMKSMAQEQEQQPNQKNQQTKQFNQTDNEVAVHKDGSQKEMAVQSIQTKNENIQQNQQSKQNKNAESAIAQDKPDFQMQV